MSLNKEVQLDEVMGIILERLDAGGTVTFSPNGTSMLPMLRDGEDSVVLKSAKGKKLHLFDVALYRRDNGQYVLHRVIDFERNGDYVMCGDNQFARERGIRDNQILAVMSGFFRKGRSYTTKSMLYRLYTNFWYYSRPLRHSYTYGRNKASSWLGARRRNANRDKNNADE